MEAKKNQQPQSEEERKPQEEEKESIFDALLDPQAKESEEKGQVKEEEQVEEKGQEEEGDPDERFRETLVEMARNILGEGEGEGEKAGEAEGNGKKEEEGAFPEISIDPEQFVSEDGELDYVGLVKSVKEESQKAITAAVNEVKKNLERETEALKTNLSASLMLDKFLAANPDLERYREYVVVKWDTILKKEPEITYSKLFDKLRKEVRADLRLPARGFGDGGGLPPESSSTRKPSKQKSALQQMLDEHYRGRR